MENKTYELGYLLTPLLTEELVAELLEKKVKALIAKEGGELVSEQAPKLISLAYPIRKQVENKHLVFRDSFFGAIRFTAAPAAAPALAAELKKLPELVRFLLITLPDITEEAPARRGPAPEGKKLEENPTEPALTTAEAIDKEIDKLTNHVS